MILNDNSTQQINTLVIQLQNKITNLTNEFRKLNNSIDDLGSEISDLEKRVSSNENDADNNIDGLDSKISDLEKRVSSNENAAAAMNTEIEANTEAISGKADKIHTHTKSEITDFPTSLPANGGTADKATQDGNGNVIASTYVKKSGDTLTGPIVMKADQYTLETAQLDMKNSDIKGANAIWFDDHAEVGEGLKFPRSSGSNYDFMRLDDGKIKVAPNVTVNAKTATESIVAYTSDIPKAVKFADYKTESLTFSSLTDQKKIELSNFGPGVTEDNVLSFMVIYWSGVHIIAQGDWAKSQGTGSSGLSCALHSLNNGTGYCVIRCVYLV